jgi:hypothetical protein
MFDFVALIVILALFAGLVGWDVYRIRKQKPTTDEASQVRTCRVCKCNGWLDPPTHGKRGDLVFKCLGCGGCHVAVAANDPFVFGVLYVDTDFATEWYCTILLSNLETIPEGEET